LHKSQLNDKVFHRSQTPYGAIDMLLQETTKFCECAVKWMKARVVGWMDARVAAAILIDFSSQDDEGDARFGVFCSIPPTTHCTNGIIPCLT
jgi:hypothetical protein